MHGLSSGPKGNIIITEKFVVRLVDVLVAFDSRGFWRWLVKIL